MLQDTVDARAAGSTAPSCEPGAVAEPAACGDAPLRDLAWLAARAADCAGAAICAFEGAGVRQVAAHGAACDLASHGHALRRALGEGAPRLVVADAAADARLRGEPGRAGGPRFHVAIALHGAEGHLLGALAVSDPAPRAVVPESQLAVLDRIARLAAFVLESGDGPRAPRDARRDADGGADALLVVDPAGSITFANVAAQVAFGPGADAGRTLDALFDPALQTDAGAARLLDGDTAAGTPATCLLRACDADGELRVYEATRSRWPSGGDAEAGVVLALRDVTEGVDHREAARLDALTGLANREGLLAMIQGLHARDVPVGVALLGLDNFRATNDILGHAIGDTVLQVVASRLLAWLPTDAWLARYGGDEFALVFPASMAGAIEAQLPSMLRGLARSCEVDYQRIHVEASVGVAVDDAGDDVAAGALRASASELLARAGLAMQHAKRAGTRHVRRFDPAMRTEAIDRRRLDLELRRAFHQGEFELHYQPQLDLASGQPTGAEALLRWRHPERGLLMPAVFIDALAHSAIAPAVGRWILRRACADAAAWPEVGGRRLKVGVNLFPVQFDDDALPEEVEQALSLSGLRPERLEIELTETIALRDDGVAEQTLARLRARGMRVSYDDFGTGHASLSMLHRLPVDRVKIDRSFVREVATNRGDEAIVRSIALIARNFDMQVIAEGVESHGQADLLREIGCHEVQGFLYAAALAPADFRRWLERHGAAAREHGHG
ncbi:MAG TPA: EAL domain-containing protein [Luteimonas sp.]|nr:EAL domain-containing protein [Luteimonas sp.]